MDTNRSVFFDSPVADILAADRIVRCIQITEMPCDLGPEIHTSKGGFSAPDPAEIAIHIFNHSAICVMVQGMHLVSAGTHV